MLKDSAQYLTYWPQVVRAFAGAAFAEATADSIAGCGGVALWLPPGVGSDEDAMGALVQEAVPADEHDEVFGVLGQMDEFHSTEPH